MRKRDLIGKVFGCWSVVAASEPQKIGAAFHSMWRCRCVCGVERSVSGSNIVAGRSKSCGCSGKSSETHKRCPRCLVMKEHAAFYPARSVHRGRKLNVYCRGCSLARSAAAYRDNPDRKLVSRRYSAKLRQETIAAYGGRCACCGESNQVFLAIDHVHGGGTKELTSGGGAKFYSRLRKLGFPRDDYQCLCHNCNWAKHVTGGRCPHSLVVAAASVSSGVLSFGA